MPEKQPGREMVAIPARPSPAWVAERCREHAVSAVLTPLLIELAETMCRQGNDGSLCTGCAGELAELLAGAAGTDCPPIPEPAMRAVLTRLGEHAEHEVFELGANVALAAACAASMRIEQRRAAIATAPLVEAVRAVAECYRIACSVHVSTRVRRAGPAFAARAVARLRGQIAMALQDTRRARHGTVPEVGTAICTPATVSVDYAWLTARRWVPYRGLTGPLDDIEFDVVLDRYHVALAAELAAAGLVLTQATGGPAVIERPDGPLDVADEPAVRAAAEAADMLLATWLRRLAGFHAGLDARRRHHMALVGHP